MKSIFKVTLKINFQSKMLRILCRRYHCRKCEFVEEKTSALCGKCSHLLEIPPKINYFKLLGYQRDTTSPDVEKLSSAYKNLQWHLHPDKYVNKEESEKELAESWSALINTAYETLKKPSKIYDYILELNDHQFKEDHMEIPREFLEDLMDKNEELLVISDSEKLSEFSEENDKNLQECYKNFDLSYKRKDFVEARRVLAKMKYYFSLQEKIMEVEENIN